MKHISDAPAKAWIAPTYTKAILSVAKADTTHGGMDGTYVTPGQPSSGQFGS